MFKENRNTVIVLGAGASWHYGYPTGEALVGDIIWCAEKLKHFAQSRRATPFNLDAIPQFMSDIGFGPGTYVEEPWVKLESQCDDLMTRLRTVQPLVIDYFLGWNKDLEQLGRVLIAGALLQRQTRNAGRTNYNRYLDARRGNEPSGNSPWQNYPYDRHNDNWIRFLVHQLLLGCETSEMLPKNKINFITFNYDRSLENGLLAALSKIKFLRADHIEAFLAGNRFVHMYGELVDVGHVEDLHVVDLNFNNNARLQNAERAMKIFNAWSDASKHLKVIDPHSKNGDSLIMARTLVGQAKRLYFLGFGFDRNNLERLGLPIDLGSRTVEETYFTNFHNVGSVNRRAAHAFRQGELVFNPFSNFGGALTYRSERSVYDAIDLDFGHFEDDRG
jgi:hypothetical protein